LSGAERLLRTLPELGVGRKCLKKHHVQVDRNRTE
jgi:hypothetical protein